MQVPGERKFQVKELTNIHKYKNSGVGDNLWYSRNSSVGWSGMSKVCSYKRKE